jgi:hypothetical protein
MWRAIMPSAAADLGMAIIATMHRQRNASLCTMRLRVPWPSWQCIVFALVGVVSTVEWKILV